MIQLNEDFKQVTVRQGETFEISLKDSLNGDYKWELRVSQGTAPLLRREIVSIDKSELPDELSTKSRNKVDVSIRSTFKAAEQGIVEIHAIHVSPSGNLVDRVKKFTITVSP